jgi:hypothetical protein
LPPLVARNSFDEESDSNSDNDNDKEQEDEFTSIRNDEDALISEDFDELCIDPESRRTWFQPQAQEPQESQEPQEPESNKPSIDEDNRNRRSQRS